MESNAIFGPNEIVLCWMLEEWVSKIYGNFSRELVLQASSFIIHTVSSNKDLWRHLHDDIIFSCFVSISYLICQVPQGVKGVSWDACGL